MSSFPLLCKAFPLPESNGCKHDKNVDLLTNPHFSPRAYCWDCNNIFEPNLSTHVHDAIVEWTEMQEARHETPN